MPPRSSWKGFLKLSLVSVPVKSYTASASSSEIRLNQLHKGCNHRIKYRKVCPEHGEVSAEDIVSGYEYGKGQYVQVDTDELSKIRAQSDKSVGLHGFVSPAEIDPVFFAGRTQYLVPDGAVAQKPYALLVKAMVEGDIVALGEVVMGGREQLVMIRPMDGLLAMAVLYYREKIKGVDSIRDEVQPPELSREEVQLTNTLVKASMIEDFDLARYRDKHVEQLTELITAKVEGKEIVAVPDPEEPRILNLMDALKQSVEQMEKGARKMAPSARTRTAGATRKRKKKSG